MKKILALLFAVVLICSVIPAAGSDAADMPKLNASKRLIYVGGSTVQTGTYSKGYYTLKVKNKPSKYKCSWSTDAPEVVSVEKLKGGKAKVTALKPGTAVVTADFTDKTTNTRYTLTSTITVIRNCAAIEISGYNGAPVKVDSIIQLTGKMYDPAGKELKAGEDTRDTFKWTSSDVSVATVSKDGAVKALNGGKVDITCYTVQAETGKYSNTSKATAKKTITVVVEEPEVAGIAEATPKSMNSVEITLASEKLGTLTKDNFSITADGGSGMAIKSLNAGSDKDKVVLVTEKEFTDQTSYTVVIKNTAATVNLMKSFTFTKGIPFRIEVDTPVGNGKVIANSMTQLKFRLYNEQGVDITPLNEMSEEYLTHKMCVRYEQVNSGNWFVYEGAVFIYDENQAVEIRAVYSRAFEINGTYVPVTIEGKGTVYSVGEATTVVFDPTTDIVIDNANTAGDKLKFEGKDLLIPVNDESGKSLIARVKRYDGKYIYSNDVGSPIEFQPETTSVCFVDTSGRIDFNTEGKTGSDVIKILYNRQVIGTVQVTIIDARKASALLFEAGGKNVSGYTVSDVFGVGATRIKIKVLDQYGNILDIKGYDATGGLASNITIEKISGPYTAAYVSSDGTAYMDFEAYGYGSTDGKDYQYKVTYSEQGKGTVTGYFNLTVKTPLTSIPSTYKLMINGKTDITLGSSANALPKVDLVLYELKDNLIYNTISTVYTSDNVVYENNCFYKLYKEGNTNEIKDAGCVKNSAIYLVYENADGKLTKLEPGKYSVVVYKKISSGIVNIATESFTITDDDSKIEISLKKDTTSETLTKESASDVNVLRTVFAECFTVKKGNEEVPVTNISFPERGISSDKYGIFFPSVIVTDTVTVGGKTYTLEQEIELRQYIKTK
ncbi:MAG: Ig-like domain-containing protein [Lachnospiraceae bacterium]|nr:Ig-like domain-containing protein [Lachnospiraceae bacterium]